MGGLAGMDPGLATIEYDLSDSVFFYAQWSVDVRAFPKDSIVEPSEFPVDQIAVIKAHNVRSGRIGFGDFQGAYFLFSSGSKLAPALEKFFSRRCSADECCEAENGAGNHFS